MTPTRSAAAPLRTGCRLLALALLFALPAAASEPPSAADVRTRLTSGQPAEALELARTGLEFHPDDPAMLAAAADAAEAAGARDTAIHYVGIGLKLPNLTAADRQAFATKLGALDPKPGAVQTLLDEYAVSVLELAKGFERRKLYANAVDLLQRCAGTSSADAADKLLDRIYGNARAVESLLDSGVDVPVEPKKAKKSAADIARIDAKHRRWDDHYEVKTANYTIKTNMGYEMAHAISTAMEQMGLFYRKVFRHKERGGTMRRCVIHIYAERAEFDEHEAYFSPSPYVGGFFVPLQNRVAVYDHRTAGGTLADLWDTLFHEASHQFTSAVTKNLIPGWLNEGTASYFEGARLTPNGRVETNLIPEGRLRPLYQMMGHGKGSLGREMVQLRDVLAYHQPGSYSGAYYPWGWGLVYFIHNYENDASERIYLEPYNAFWQAYSGGGKHDVVSRFIEYFVTRPADPAVDTFQKFEHRFAMWIAELYELHFGGPEQADKLIARGRKQQSNGKHEYAVDSYRWALTKRANELGPTYGLAVAYHELERADAALYHLRRAVELSRRETDPTAKVPHFGDLTVEALAADARARMARINDALSAGADESVTALEERVLALADELVAEGYPLAALGLLDRSTKLMGATASLVRSAEDVRREHGVDIRRWRRQPVDPDLESWDTVGKWKAAGWTVKSVASGNNLAFAYGPATVGPAWRYEVDVQVAAPEPGGSLLFGLAFGVRSDGSQRLIGLSSRGTVFSISLAGDEPPDLERSGSFDFEPDEVFNVAIEARGDEIEIFVDGESVAVKSMSPSDLAGRLGYFSQGAEASFANARIFE